jgi:acyl-CoA reductase-like NAD-dependent aldehyde dehydrogenase
MKAAEELARRTQWVGWTSPEARQRYRSEFEKKRSVRAGQTWDELNNEERLRTVAAVAQLIRNDDDVLAGLLRHMDKLLPIVEERIRARKAS